MELIETRPEVSVAEAEYQRLLGFPPNYQMDGRPRELAEQARQWYAQHGRPWIYARQTGELNLSGPTLRINGAEFSSQRLRQQLAEAGAHQGVLVAVSAGPECEAEARRLWQEGKPDEYFFMEIFGSAVVEHLVTVAGARLCGWAEPLGMAVLPHYSPGYTGWDVSDQTRLFALLREGMSKALPGDIEAHDTGMLRPKKSLLAFFGVTAQPGRLQSVRDLVPCNNCAFNPCQYRRAPFTAALPSLEDVRRLQPVVRPEASRPALDYNAKYSVNTRALRKWSKERLQLEFLPDSSIEARFRYEGTTCTNLGHPLVFDYFVKLASASQNYRVEQARCAPARGDEGHTKMCAWINNPAGLAARIAAEQPLLGRPLNDLLAWERRFSPSGCYCDADGRTHKWGLALEVMHFALVEHEKSLKLSPT